MTASARPRPRRLSRRRWLALVAGAAGVGVLAGWQAPQAVAATLSAGVSSSRDGAGGTGDASRAVALLVGNTAYNPNDDDLPPALKCLVDLAGRLERLGYAPQVLHDPSKAEVIAAIGALRRRVAEDARLHAVFYFVGHGFQSDGENYLIPAGGDVGASAAQLAATSLSVERDVFAPLRRDAGPAATTILVDACRTLDRPARAQESRNQTLPPEGCHVAFATGPGQRAFAPSDPQRHTFFAEALVDELDLALPQQSVLATLEGVRVRVARRVNDNDAIRAAFGENAQQPELASNVRGDPPWIGAVAVATAAATTGATGATGAADEPIAAGERPGRVDGDVARQREEAAARARSTALRVGLDPDADPDAVPAPDGTARREDVLRARGGDIYAALRVAESCRRPAPGELIERTAYGRWMAFAAYMGNGIAAYRLSLWFRNVDRRDAEAARYLRLARQNHYTPPKQLDTTR